MISSWTSYCKQVIDKFVSLCCPHNHDDLTFCIVPVNDHCLWSPIQYAIFLVLKRIVTITQGLFDISSDDQDLRSRPTIDCHYLITTLTADTPTGIHELSGGGGVSLVVRALDSQLEKVGSNLACALKQGTSSHLLHLWIQMEMVVVSAETDYVHDFRR